MQNTFGRDPSAKIDEVEIAEETCPTTSNQNATSQKVVPESFAEIESCIDSRSTSKIVEWWKKRGQRERKMFALRQTQWDEEERGDKRRRKTIRKRERQRG